MKSKPFPKRYTILREIENGYKVTEIEERPKQVWTLIDEVEFLKRGLIHWETAFIEDFIHDWNWNKGKFQFYGHSGKPGEKHNLVLVYEEF